jgi:tetratricopeptide (TPR) repeat protein
MTPRKTVWVIAAVLVICLGAVVVKVQVEGTRTLAAAREALTKKDPERARQLFLQAGRWYLPGGAVRQQAAEALLGIGDTYRGEGNLQEAVLAYDDARAVFYATAAHPSDPLLDRANKSFAETLAAWQKSTDSKTDEAALSARFLEQAKRRDLPSSVLTFLTGVGLLAWVGSTFWAIRTSGRRRLLALGVASVSFLVWLLALVFLGP